MPCDTVKMPGGLIAIVCSRGRRKAKRCACGAVSTKLCDFVTPREDYSHGVPSTCDKPLCDACAVSVEPNRDHCPDHPAQPSQQLAMEGI